MFRTYGTELVKRAEELYDQVHRSTVDGRVDNVQKLGRLSDDIERLDIVRLFPQVVLVVQS